MSMSDIISEMAYAVARTIDTTATVHQIARYRWASRVYEDIQTSLGDLIEEYPEDFVDSDSGDYTPDIEGEIA